MERERVELIPDIAATKRRERERNADLPVPERVRMIELLHERSLHFASVRQIGVRKEWLQPTIQRSNQTYALENRMSNKMGSKSVDIGKVVAQLLKEHPDAKRALDTFGIALDQYQQSLSAQQRPRFYSGASTD